MPVFESAEQLYEVMGALFDRLKATPEIADGLLEGKMVVRFHWKGPDGQATSSPITSPRKASGPRPSPTPWAPRISNPMLR